MWLDSPINILGQFAGKFLPPAIESIILRELAGGAGVGSDEVSSEEYTGVADLLSCCWVDDDIASER